MSATAVDKAIYAHWNTNSLSATITGGVHDRVPERTQLPYCEYKNESVTLSLRTNTSRYDTQSVMFAVYDRTKALVGSHADLIANAFDDAELSLEDGTALQAKLVSGPLLDDVDKAMWRAELVFDVMKAKAR